MRFLALFLSLATASGATQEAQPIITFESVPEELDKITPDEPFASEFSLKNTALYLDRAALICPRKAKHLRLAIR